MCHLCAFCDVLARQDTVVVVTCDPIDADVPIEAHAAQEDSYRLAPMRTLLRQLSPTIPESEMTAMNFGDLRNALIEIDPLNTEHIKKVNAAEAEFWHRSSGVRVGYSDEILGFECGGQQWVSEVAFPTGSLARSGDPGKAEGGRTGAYTGADIAFMRRLLGTIASQNLPAPAPLEQRWSASSRSLMSPVGITDDANVRADVANGIVDKDTVHCWVGIIMYLPTSDGSRSVDNERRKITEAFTEYAELLRPQLDQYCAHEHWAKIEVRRPQSAEALRQRLGDRFPVGKFAAARERLDPKGILSNDLYDTLLPTSPTTGAARGAP